MMQPVGEHAALLYATLEDLRERGTTPEALDLEQALELVREGADLAGLELEAPWSWRPTRTGAGSCSLSAPWRPGGCGIPSWSWRPCWMPPGTWGPCARRPRWYGSEGCAA